MSLMGENEVKKIISVFILLTIVTLASCGVTAYVPDEFTTAAERDDLHGKGQQKRESMWHQLQCMDIVNPKQKSIVWRLIRILPLWYGKY